LAYGYDGRLLELKGENDEDCNISRRIWYKNK
jgi:hypothetical protein